MWCRTLLRRVQHPPGCPKDPSLLIGVGRPRTPEQYERYCALRNTTIQSAFPHIAACWVGPTWGSVMMTPHHVSPTCRKSAVWQCSQCRQEFEMSIAKFIDQHGVCPLCGQTQREVTTSHTVSNDAALEEEESTRASSSAYGTTSTAPASEEEGEEDNAAWVGAPRMIHTKYKSVLHSNPEWEGRNILPMLAQKWDVVRDEFLNSKGPWRTEGLLVSPKIDGIRCLIGYNEERREPQFFSRSGIILECCDNLVSHVMPLFQDDPSLLLDGELFAPEFHFEELSGIVRRQRKFLTEAIQRMQEKLEYYAFDIMASDQLSSPNAPFSERYRLLEKLFPPCAVERIVTYYTDKNKKLSRKKRLSKATKNTPKLYHVPATLIQLDEVEETLLKASHQGFEGIILRQPHSPYEHGKRSPALLKYKTMNDAEYRIVDFLPGQGRFEGGLGAFICETKDGILFHATPRATMKRRLELWGEREQYRGKYLTVQYQHLHANDVPRFPIGKCVRGSSEDEWL
uniref:Putative DNA ligase n=1 Tax=Trypanosoma congolense (strain IL3000) TaxID=1068625 RepID=G0UPB9_TRYCI|nr:putative DNA ligase [Trypanosoma congolense IL3000]